jgi:hypothetical protein
MKIALFSILLVLLLFIGCTPIQNSPGDLFEKFKALLAGTQP